LPIAVSKLSGKGLFADNVLSINGALKPNKNIKLFMNGNHLADLQSDQAGVWDHQLDLTKIPEGEHKVQYAPVDNNNKIHVLVEKPMRVHKQSW
jgi:hypothetical protein